MSDFGKTIAHRYVKRGLRTLRSWRRLSVGDITIQINAGSAVSTLRAMIGAGLSISFASGDLPQLTKYDVFYGLGVTRKGDLPPEWAVAAARLHKG